jgi:autophagy-related protein 13
MLIVMQFNIELDEMETFRDELRPWRLGDSFDPRPPALIIETYLDTGDLTPTQALVILDSNDKRWNVTETLENATNRAGLNVGLRRGERGAAGTQQIVLERWRIELRYASFGSSGMPQHFG